MNNIGEKLICVGALLILVAFGILIKNNYEDYLAGEDSTQALEILNNYITEVENNNIKVDDENLTLKNINGFDYALVITIPSINLELPVLADWDYTKLKKAPCIYYGSIMENNLVILGHNYRSHFGSLSKLEANEKIIITDLNSNKYIYEVANKTVIDPHDSKEVIETDYDLTIFSCYNSGTQRIVINANRIY